MAKAKFDRSKPHVNIGLVCKFASLSCRLSQAQAVC